MERHFHEELKKLNENLLKMAAMAEDSIFKAIESLKRCDVAEAENVISSDAKTDDMENVIEEQCVKLLALQQPLAGDLRFITTAMRVNGELERIADLAVNIAERVKYNLSGEKHIKPLEDILKLSDISRLMVKKSIDAFVKHDDKLAKEVILADPEADRLRNSIYNELVDEHLVKDGSTAPRVVPLILISRYLERMCDHATYIAQDVIYMVEAKMVKHHLDEIVKEEKRF